jgi:hypothetical protein
MGINLYTMKASRALNPFSRPDQGLGSIILALRVLLRYPAPHL